jgi:Zn-dependent oligopeptidase
MEPNKNESGGRQSLDEYLREFERLAKRLQALEKFGADSHAHWNKTVPTLQSLGELLTQCGERLSKLERLIPDLASKAEVQAMRQSLAEHNALMTTQSAFLGQISKLLDRR